MQPSSPPAPSNARQDMLSVAKRHLQHARYREGWAVCEALLSRAGGSSWEVQAVAARTLLEWGKGDDTGLSQQLLSDSLLHFDYALALLRSEAAAEPDDNDDLVELENDRGVALYESAEMDAARVAFESVLLMRPQHDKALCNLGLILWSDGQEMAALSALNRAVKAAMARGGNPHALNNRGALRLELGEAELSLPDFHFALELDPHYEIARRNRDAALGELCEPVPLPPVDEPEEV